MLQSGRPARQTPGLGPGVRTQRNEVTTMRRAHVSIVLLVVTLLALPAQAQQIGTIGKEAPDQIGVYEVRLAAGASLKPGDIMTIDHGGKRAGEAAVLSVKASSAQITLRGVFDVSVGDPVAFARSPQALTSVASEQREPGAIPAGFARQDDGRGCAYGIPPGLAQTGAHEWGRGSTKSGLFNVSVALATEANRDYESNLGQAKSAAKAYGGSVEEGKLHFEGVDYKMIRVETPVKPPNVCGDIMMYVFTPQHTFVVEAMFANQSDRTAAAQFINSFSITP